MFFFLKKAQNMLTVINLAVFFGKWYKIWDISILKFDRKNLQD